MLGFPILLFISLSLGLSGFLALRRRSELPQVLILNFVNLVKMVFVFWRGHKSRVWLDQNRWSLELLKFL